MTFCLDSGPLRLRTAPRSRSRRVRITRCPTIDSTKVMECARRWHARCCNHSHGGGGPPKTRQPVCRATIWASRFRRGPVEGTSPSHKTTHRPLPPASLDVWAAPNFDLVGKGVRRNGPGRSGFGFSRSMRPAKFRDTGRFASQASTGGCPGLWSKAVLTGVLLFCGCGEPAHLRHLRTPVSDAGRPASSRPHL